MATWQDVRRIAGALPETAERSSGHGVLEWRVRDKLFVWERPLRKKDLAALGTAAPDGPVVAAYLTHGVAKDALLADESGAYFTTPHFDGYPVILVELDRIDPTELEELIVEAWMVRAPKRVARAYEEGTR